jgi:alkanesulfonate monooxygenase SsuD/methylene tetrahydromethanopterin reductase-like flavin-dependent oxidoreductase (luciferase family)
VCRASAAARAAARNALLWLFICFEKAHVLNRRSEGRSILTIPVAVNPFVIVSVVVAQAMHIAASYTPGLAAMLDLSPLPLWQWATLPDVLEIYKAVNKARSWIFPYLELTALKNPALA